MLRPTQFAHVPTRSERDLLESPPSHPMSLGGEVWVGEVQLTAAALEAAQPRSNEKSRDK